MTIIVRMGKAVSFSPAFGVIVHPGCLRVEPDVLRKLIETAFACLKDDDLVDAHCGGRGPLADIGDVSYQEYLKIRKDCGLS